MVPIDVHVQIASGLPALTIVGLPDKAVAESVAIEQCLAWHRNGAKPEDLYQQVMGGAPSAAWTGIRSPRRPPDAGAVCATGSKAIVSLALPWKAKHRSVAT